MNQNILLVALLLIYGCQPPKAQDSKYLRWVGDIAYDTQIDSPSFVVCDESHIPQYFNFAKGMQYHGEKPALITAIHEKYKSVNTSQSGLVRIRFVVNCKGETGRFRMQAMNWEYQPQEFDHQITNQLLSITKSLSGWKRLGSDSIEKDYYQYLIFKIDNGDIIEILP